MNASLLTILSALLCSSALALPASMPPGYDRQPILDHRFAALQPAAIQGYAPTSLSVNATSPLSFANIYGVCNKWKYEVAFYNGECSGNDCNATSDSHSCDAKRAFIPKAESEGDFNGNHRMWVYVCKDEDCSTR